MGLDVTISLTDMDIAEADTMAPGVGDESTHKTVPGDLEGKKFGRLVAIRELAVGGMGQILECFDPRLRRNVVVKVLRPFPKMEAMHRARLTREARVTSQLQHAGIVPVHDIGETEDGELYYVMQKIEGCTLGDVLRGVRHRDTKIVQKWTLFRLLAAFERICSAVAFAHHRGVIHRDIKPANIMLGPFDEVLVVDWGVVRLGEAPEVNAEASLQQPVDSDEDIWAETGPGLTVGTPGFMAPEQVTGDRENIGPWSDVFSLGVVLYEILSGRQPFAGQSPVAVLVSSLRDNVEDPSVGSPWREVPRAIAAICEKAMAFDHLERYADAELLARAVSDFLDSSRREESASPYVDDGIDGLRQMEANAQIVEVAQQALAELEATVSTWSPVDDRERLHAARRHLEERLADGVRLRAIIDASARRALEVDPSNGQARALLGLAQSEEGRRNEHEPEPEEIGRLSLFTDPPGAPVVAERVDQRGLVWHTRERRSLGRTPLTRIALPPGSWILTLTAPDRSPVTYPVFLEAGVEWDSGSDPIRLPYRDELPPRTLHIPGSPSVTAYRIRQVPVTCTDYLEFLRAIDPTEAALRAPREGGQPLWPAAPAALPTRDSQGRACHPLAPVSGISWFDARAYAAWRATVDGVAWRLPTTAEWEYAARGADNRRFPWGDVPDASLCKSAHSRSGPAAPEPVGQFKMDRSVFGVRELAGGVAEWCEGTEGAARKPIRGTAWFESLDRAAAGRMRDADAETPDPGIGFRLVCDAPRPQRMPPKL